jgi:hypothetical protein
MSSQSPVVWWYREVVGMCVEAGPVLGAESVDFLGPENENDFRTLKPVLACQQWCEHYIY